jgi:hypothetical protein
MGELHPERGCEHLDPQEGAPRPVTALGSTGYRTLDPSARISGLERSDLVQGSDSEELRDRARVQLSPESRPYGLVIYGTFAPEIRDTQVIEIAGTGHAVRNS